MLIAPISQVFVVAGGFDGRNGWVQSKLNVSLAKTVSMATVVPLAAQPSRPAIIPTLVPTVTSSTVKKLPPQTRKSLPSPKS